MLDPAHEIREVLHRFDPPTIKMLRNQLRASSRRRNETERLLAASFHPDNVHGNTRTSRSSKVARPEARPEMPTMTTKVLRPEGCPRKAPSLGSFHQAPGFVPAEVLEDEALAGAETRVVLDKEEKVEKEKLRHALTVLEGRPGYEAGATLEGGGFQNLSEVCHEASREEMLQAQGGGGGRAWSMQEKLAFHQHMLHHHKAHLGAIEVEGLAGVDRSSLRSYYYTNYKGSRQHLDYKLSDRHINLCLITAGSQLKRHVTAAGISTSFHVLDECCECGAKLAEGTGKAVRVLRCCTCTNACHAVMRCSQAPVSNQWRCSECVGRHKAAGASQEHVVVADMKRVQEGMAAVSARVKDVARAFLEDKFESKVRAALYCHVQRRRLSHSHHHQQQQHEGEGTQAGVGGAEPKERKPDLLERLLEASESAAREEVGQQAQHTQSLGQFATQEAGEEEGPPPKKLKGEEGSTEEQARAE